MKTAEEETRSRKLGRVSSVEFECQRLRIVNFSLRHNTTSLKVYASSLADKNAQLLSGIKRISATRGFPSKSKRSERERKDSGTIVSRTTKGDEWKNSGECLPLPKGGMPAKYDALLFNRRMGLPHNQLRKKFMMLSNPQVPKRRDARDRIKDFPQTTL